MKKSLKVKKLIDENGIEVENFTMVLRLKKIIEELNLKINQQNQTIIELKRDSKTTKINEMEVEIQHLNDQNKRLVLLIQEIKQKYNVKKDGLGGYLKNGIPSASSSKPSEGPDFMKNGQNGKARQKKKKSQNKKDSTSTSLLFGSNFGFSSQLMTSNSKKSYPEAQKQKQQQLRQQLKQKKFQKKYYELLEETEKLKKELINLKLNEQLMAGKKGRSFISIDKNSTFLAQNMECLDKVTQKKHDLEAENEILKGKLQVNEKRIKEVQAENESVCKVMENLKNELKRKATLQSDGEITQREHALKDVSNLQFSEDTLPVEKC